MLACCIDMFLTPLHVAETRFILQNRSKSFCAYPSVKGFFTNTPLRDMVRGIFMNIPRNFLVALSGKKIADDSMPLVNYYGMALLSQTIAYPFLTVQRRMECASKSESLILKGTAFKDAP